MTEPVETVKKIGTGIGSWFSDVGHAITSKDPNQPGIAKTALGQAAAKRVVAYRLGVNPYTRSKELQSGLDDVAWVSFAGGLTVKAAFAVLPETARRIVRVSSTSDSMKRLVRDKSPAELHALNKKSLLAIGATPNMADEFLSNYAFDPYEKTLLTGALQSMGAVQNRSAFIWSALAVDDPSVALFLRVQAEHMASYAGRHRELKSMVDVCGKMFFKTKDNEMVGIFPLDYVAWTERLDNRERLISAAIEKLGARSKKFIVYGKIDSKAREMLELRGWAVVQEKPADGA